MPMRNRLSLGVVMVSLALSSMVYAQEVKLGSSVEGLLQAARERNPEIASMRFDADAAAERVVPAGALPDPKFSMELRDLTRMGERNPTLLPGRVGSTRYLLTQELPWFGKRGLKRESAQLQAEAARGRVAGTWSELLIRRELFMRPHRRHACRQSTSGPALACSPTSSCVLSPPRAAWPWFAPEPCCQSHASNRH